MSVLPASTIWRDKEVDGVYSSPNHDPIKADIREWAAWVEGGLIAGTLNGPWEATLSALNAKLAYGAGNPGFVYAGADFGTYRKSGASGSGSWVKILDTIPGYQVVKATNAGAGTANSIVATSAPPVSYSDGMQIIGVNITANNTSEDVTINFNGMGALEVRTASNNKPAIDGLVAPVRIWGQVDQSGTVFRMMSDQASAAVLAGAEAVLAEFKSHNLGAFADDAAATAAAGGAPITGAIYWNTTSNVTLTFDGAGWVNQTTTVNDGDVSETKLADSLAQKLVTIVDNISSLRGVDASRYQGVRVRDRLTGGHFNWRSGDQSSLAVVKSVTTTTVDAGTDVFTATAHGLYDSDVVIAMSAVNGLVLETKYYVSRIDANTFKLCTSYANHLAATFVDVTGTTNLTFKHLRDPEQGVYVIGTGDALDGTGGLWERARGAVDERNWWPFTNEGLQCATDFANRLSFAAGSESVKRIYIKKASVVWEGEGMFASVVNFTHTSGIGMWNVLRTSGSTLQNGLVIRDMQVNGASLTSSGSIIELRNYGYSHLERVYFFGVQVNQTFAVDVRGTWPMGTYYCSIQHCIFGLMQFGIYLGDGGNNNLIAHNRFQQASPGGGQCITLDGTSPGYISSTVLLANITELPGNVTVGVYVGAAVDGLTIIGHRYESMLIGLLVALGAKHVLNLNPYYEGCTTNVNNASRGMQLTQVAAGSFYGVAGIIEYQKPYNGTATRASTGLYRVTFVTALPNANYSVRVGGTAIHTRVEAKTTTYVDIECLNASHARVDADNIDFEVNMAA
jgi:hypothetical protein